MGKEAPRPLTAMEILRKGVKLFWRSCKSMLSTLLIILVLSCLSCYRTWSVVAPSASGVLRKLRILGIQDSGTDTIDGIFRGLRTDLRQIGRAVIVGSLISYLLYSFIVIAIIYTVAMVGKGRKVALKDLAVRTRRTWMGVMATSLFVCFLTSGYLSFCVFLLSAVGFFGGVSAASLALIAAVAILEFLLFLYLSMLWSQAVVVSVMEEGRSGLDALGRAAERVRGRKGLGFRVNSLLFLAVALVQTLISTAVTLLSLPNLISPIIFSLVYLLVIVLIQAVNVVFYYECQENQEDAATMKENLAYTRALREEP
ncbi:unnamed protein product [Spirodela intermedia]|uniref:Uncharacterized protein n=1 Tax=Spirodela intermedia TaxID=51605 RepID=A0A7I8KM15_SPIIN|nr:unnamed protein product [Spirodela intermedia]